MYRRHTGTRTAKVPQESMSALERLRKFVRDAETEILLNGRGIYRQAYGTGEGGPQVIISRLSPTKLIEKARLRVARADICFLNGCTIRSGWTGYARQSHVNISSTSISTKFWS